MSEPPDGDRYGADAASPLNARALLAMGIGIQLALMPPTMLAAMLDHRLLNGISVWSKPLKFECSLALNLLTLLVLLALLAPGRDKVRFLRVSAVTITVASTLEIAYIVLQAARGLASHFNHATALAEHGYQLMGLGAVALVGATFNFGLAFWKAPVPITRPGLRLGAVLGLTFGAALTLVTAGAMSSEMLGHGHWVGGMQSDANGLPIFGWSRSGGDLRVPHFFATHLMQALPVLGVLADWLSPKQARSAVLLGAVVGMVLVSATGLQALRGYPLLGR